MAETTATLIGKTMMSINTSTTDTIKAMIRGKLVVPVMPDTMMMLLMSMRSGSAGAPARKPVHESSLLAGDRSDRQREARSVSGHGDAPRHDGAKRREGFLGLLDARRVVQWSRARPAVPVQGR